MVTLKHGCFELNCSIVEKKFVMAKSKTLNILEDSIYEEIADLIDLGCGLIKS